MAALDRDKVIPDELLQAPYQLADGFDAVSKSLREVVTIAREVTKSLSSGKQSTEGQKKAADELARAQEKLSKANQQITKDVAKLNVQTQERNKQIKQEAKESLGLVGAYSKLTKELNEARKAYKDLAASGKATNEELAKQKAIVDSLNNKVKTIDNAVGQFQRNVGNYPKTFNAATDALKSFLGAFGVVVGIQLFAQAIKYAIGLNVEFGRSISELSALTGAVGQDLEFYKEQAIEIGGATGTSAIETVKAIKLIGSARPELLKVKDDLVEVTKSALILAKASGLDLPEAADALAGALNQLGLPASKASQVINALAAGSQAGAAEVPQMNEALQKFGSVAKTANVNIEETVGLIETLADNQLKGAEAGTALRNILLRISAVQTLPRDAQTALKAYGVNLKYVSDTAVPLNLRLREFSKISNDLNAIVDVFGKENAVAGQVLLQNVTRFEMLTRAVTGTNTAFEQAETNTNNLGGDIDEFKSSIDALIITAGTSGNIFNDVSRSIVQLLTKYVEFIRTNETAAEGIKLAFTPLRILVRFFEIIRDLLSDLSKYSGEFNFILSQLAETFKTIVSFLVQIPDYLTGFVYATIEAFSVIVDAAKETFSLVGDLVKAAFDPTQSIAIVLSRSITSVRDYGERIGRAFLEGFNKYKDHTLEIIDPKKSVARPGVASPKNPIKPYSTTADKSAKDRVDYENKLAQSIIKIQLDANEEILRNEQSSLEERNEATRKAFANKQALLRLQYEANVKLSEGNIVELIRLEKEYVAESERLGVEYKNSFEKNFVDAVVKFTKKSQEEGRKQLDSLDQLLIDGEISVKEYQKRREELELNTNVRILEIQKEFILEQISQAILLGTTTTDLQKKLADTEIAITKAKVDAILAEEERAFKKKQENQQLIDASLQFGQTVFDGIVDNRNAALDNELAKNEERKKKELELAGDNERKKAQIQKKFDREQAKIKAKQAQEDKNAALFSIAINTASAIVRTAAQLGFPAAIPFIAIAAATGLAQSIIVASRDVPKFWMGSDYTPDTFIAGDRGSELISYKGDTFLTPNRPTLYSGMEGAMVVPHPKTEEILGSLEDADISRSILRNLNLSNTDSRYYSNGLDSEILGEMKQVNKNMKSLHAKESLNADSFGNIYKSIKDAEGNVKRSRASCMGNWVK